MLRNIWSVACRDFLAVVRTKGFLIGLVFLPGVIMASAGLPKLLERFGETGERRFAVADFTGRLAAPIAAHVAKSNAEPRRRLTVALDVEDLAGKGWSAEGFGALREKVTDELAERVRAQQLFGYLIIGPRVLDVPSTTWHGDATPSDTDVIYGAVSLTTGDLRRVVVDALNDCVRAARLTDAGVKPELVDRIDQEPTLKESIVSNRGVVASNDKLEALVPTIVVVLLLMGVMQSAGLLLTSTIEEKSNRVVEVLVSSVTPFELLSGKVIGAWLTGLVTLLAWGGAGAFTAEQFNVLRAGMLDTGNLAWFAYFYFAGYLLFASLYAAVGAMCSSIQDAQSMMFPIVLLIMIPMFSLAHVMQHPDSRLSQALTWFPFSAPFIAVMRLTLLPPAPQWQIALAAVSVALGALFFMWAAGKVFRVAIFMAGKPPKFREVVRWIREA